MSNRWIMVYDDGRTSAIHATEVEAETMADALAASGLAPNHVWACALHGPIGTAATSLLTTTRLGLTEIDLQDGT
ncbi:MAG: hypothetical protein ACREX9_03340 [Gammaproteobacteria bacterium]